MASSQVGGDRNHGLGSADTNLPYYHYFRFAYTNEVIPRDLKLKKEISWY